MKYGIELMDTFDTYSDAIEEANALKKKFKIINVPESKLEQKILELKEDFCDKTGLDCDKCPIDSKLGCRIMNILEECND